MAAARKSRDDSSRPDAERLTHADVAWLAENSRVDQRVIPVLSKLVTEREEAETARRGRSRPKTPQATPENSEPANEQSPHEGVPPEAKPADTRGSGDRPADEQETAGAEEVADAPPPDEQETAGAEEVAEGSPSHEPLPTGDSSHPLIQVDVEELPAEALRLIEEQEGEPPEVRLVCKYKESYSWLVATGRTVWRVTVGLSGWVIGSAGEQEWAALSCAGPKQLAGGAPSLIQVKVEELPEEALRLIEKEEGEPPEVQSVGRRRGGGHPRWRVTTSRNVWRVTVSLSGLAIKPAGEEERAEELSCAGPKLPRKGPPSPVQIPVEELPAEALRLVEEQEGEPPEVRLVCKYKGSGPPRWRVTTGRNVWRVTKNPSKWTVKCMHSMVQIPVSELPQETPHLIEEREGSPPRIRLAYKCHWSGPSRWLVSTELHTWCLTRGRDSWTVEREGEPIDQSDPGQQPADHEPPKEESADG